MALTHDKDERDRTPEFGSERGLAPYGSVADKLQRTREEHGQDLRTVAQVLRIRYAYLEAIESGDFDALPGPTYAVGFLRTYAEFLGLDCDEIVQQFKQETQNHEQRQDLVFPEPISGGRIPLGAALLIAVVALGLGYGGWFALSNQGKSLADLVTPLSERMQTMIAEYSGGDPERQSASLSTNSVPAQTFTPPEAETETEAEAEAEAEQPVAEAVSSQPGAHEPDLPEPITPPSPATEPAIAADTTPVPAGIADTEETDDRISLPSEVGSVIAQSEDRDAGSLPGPTAVEPQSAAVADADDAQVQNDVTESAPAPAVTQSAMETPVTAAQSVAAVPVPDAGGAQAAANEPPTPDVTVSAASPSEPQLVSTSSREPAPAADGPYMTEPAAPNATAQTSVIAAQTDDAAGQVESAAVDSAFEETVVIPSPPKVPQTLEMPIDRSPQIYGDSNDETRIVLRAIQDSWVQIRDHQDSLLLTRVLRSGDMYYVPARDGLTLLTGNAGGLAIEVDGVAIPSLGPIGAVRRQIMLDPARLQDGTAIPR